MTPALKAKAARLASVALLPVLALPVLLQGLDRWPRWDAETWTMAAAYMPFAEMITTVAEDRHPPLFFAIEWVLWRLQPDLWLLRVPSALAVLVTIGLVQRLTRRNVGTVAGWIAGAFVAVSPYALAHGANARSSAITMLLGTLLLAVSLKLVREDRSRPALIALGLVSLVSMYVHYSMVAPIAGCGLGIILGLGLSRDRPFGQRWRGACWAVFALGLAGLMFVPWALGPMVVQELGYVEKASRSFNVLRYLFWPVGPFYMPSGSVTMLVLAMVGLLRLLRPNGRGGVVLGWTIAAVVVPWAWSDHPQAAGKFHLYAPLFGWFAFLVGAGVHWVVKTAGKLVALFDRQRRQIVIGVGIVLVYMLPSAVMVCRLPAHLVGRSTYEPGVHDTRVEAALLAKFLEGAPPTISPLSRAAQDWFYYAPQLEVLRAENKSGWRGVDAESHADVIRVRLVRSGPDCVFKAAFAAVLLVDDAEACIALHGAIGVAGLEQLYGPFLLESAHRMLRMGDTAEATRLARAAARLMDLSARPDAMLMEMYIEQKRFKEALAVAQNGTRKARSFGVGADRKRFAQARYTIADELGDTEAKEEARVALECLDSVPNAWWNRFCGTSLEGLARFSFRPLDPR